MLSVRTIESPIGTLLITADDQAITGVGLANGCTGSDRSALLDQCARELAAYFRDARAPLTVRTKAQETEFQRKVWRAMSAVGPGSTSTYREIAQRIGRPQAARAVGGACARNPLLILQPCHRVTGSNGALGGFSAGLRRKAWLLRHEEYRTYRSSS